MPKYSKAVEMLMVSNKETTDRFILASNETIRSLTERTREKTVQKTPPGVGASLKDGQHTNPGNVA